MALNTITPPNLTPLFLNEQLITRKNCFRYLKCMSPLNSAICTTTHLERQKCYGLGKKTLLKKQLFNLEVKGQAPMKVMVCDTLPYGHAPTYQISLTHLERKNVMARTWKYYLKNNYSTLKSKVKVPQRSLRYVTHRLMVMHPHTKYNWPIWKEKHVMVQTSFAEKKQKRKKKSD